MSISSNILKKLFKNQQYRIGDSKKSLTELVHTPQNFLPPAITKKKISYSTDWIDGLQYIVASNKLVSGKKKVIIYIHGGGFITQITAMHWLHIAALIKKTNAIVYVPIYPLTTDTYSSQKDTITFLLKLYKVILTRHQNYEITIMGDSAGGNFALILAQQIKKNKLKTVKNVILISPALSFEKTKEVYDDFDDEVIMTRRFLYTCQEWQLRNNNPKDPLFSPIYGDSKNIGKIYIFSATNEIFYNTIKRYSDSLLKKNIKHFAEFRNELFHDFPVLLYSKESIQTNKTICNIINSKKSI